MLEDGWRLVELAGSAIAATAIATAYLSRLIDRKVSLDTYFMRHEELLKRVHDLELWAARHGYPMDGMIDDDRHRRR